MKRVVIGILFFAVACGGPLNVKQKAVTGIQAVSTALNAAQDFERANHTALGLDVVASDAHRKLCPAEVLPGPFPVGATEHQVVSCIFAKVFDLKDKSEAQLLTWTTGQPEPSVLADLKGEVDLIFGITITLAPNPKQQQYLQMVQTTVDSVLAVVTIVKGSGQ